MSRKETVPFISAMQLAFIDGACKAIHAGKARKTATKVERVVKRTKVREVPAVNTKLSYRTAQKLISEGVIE